MNSYSTPGDPIHLELLLSKEEIAKEIKAISNRINKEYASKEITLVMILKGALFFVSDLMRELTIPTRLETLECKSYGLLGRKQGELKILGLDNCDIEGRHVIVVDDIHDTGATLSEVMSQVIIKKPKSLRSLTLLTKKVAKKTHEKPDYFLFEIEDRFVVGYGLDYKEYYRNIPAIYAMPENS
ncbi:MAG: hypoxanthine phosphoribosyltransferase [Simkaniaceae bacterium]|nr:hypoxanthine phosphoribosyltransferase [Simkaniaceae bacterium]